TDSTTPIAEQDWSGAVRGFALGAGEYLVRVSYSWQAIDSYQLSVVTSAPTTPLQRSNYVRLAGEGFGSLLLAPDGKLGQLLWYDKTLVFRATDPAGAIVEEEITTGDPGGGSSGRFTPRDAQQAQLLYLPDGAATVVLLDNGGVRSFTRGDAGWAEEALWDLPLNDGEWPSHLVAASGSDGAIHLAMAVGTFSGAGGRLVYGVARNGVLTVAQVATPAATTEYSYFTGLNPRYLSLAVDSLNFAHIAYTPEFQDNGVGGYSRPYDELAYATNRSGAWRTEIVHRPSDDSGQSNVASSIAIGPGDRPAIAHFFVDRYSTGSAQSSRLLYHERRDDGTWTNETIATQPDGYAAADGPRFTGFAPHLVFDGAGRPNVAFSDHASQHFAGFGADEFAGQIRRAVKQSGSWSLQTVLRQTDPLRNMVAFPTMVAMPREIVFVGLRRVDQLNADYTVVRSDFYYATASLPQVGLSVSFADASIYENGRTTVTIRRHNGNNSGPLDVSLVNSDSTEAVIPASVRIPAGAAQVTVDVTGVNDGQLDGSRVVKLSASATGYNSASSILNVRDIPFAQLRGAAFDDRDADGVRDVGETGLSGWTMYLDADGDAVLDPGELSATTDADGAYSIAGIPGGGYVLRAQLPVGWLATTSSDRPGVPLTLSGGDQATGIDVGARREGFDLASGLLAIAARGGENLAVDAVAGQVRVRRAATTDTSFGSIAATQVWRLLVH
ncbi:MAG TPA: SdrD B-like domain-containing protein, partial [Pirellulaceae bacterium]|nr:SdrD B-like domain-containing protein [Pirellulaceae bacterium]